MLSIEEKQEGILFKVVVVPRSSKNEAVGVHQGALKLKLKAPPVQGAARHAASAEAQRREEVSTGRDASYPLFRQTPFCQTSANRSNREFAFQM